MTLDTYSKQNIGSEVMVGIGSNDVEFYTHTLFTHTHTVHTHTHNYGKYFLVKKP